VRSNETDRSGRVSSWYCSRVAQTKTIS